jgi:hypothetical protein
VLACRCEGLAADQQNEEKAGTMNDAFSDVHGTSVLEAPTRVTRLAVVPLLLAGIAAIGAGEQTHEFELTGALARDGAQLSGTDKDGCTLKLVVASIPSSPGKVESALDVDLQVGVVHQQFRGSCDVSRVKKQVNQKSELNMVLITDFVRVPHPLNGHLFLRVSDSWSEPRSKGAYESHNRSAKLTSWPIKGADAAAALNRWTKLEAVPKWVITHANELWTTAAITCLYLLAYYLWKARGAISESAEVRATARRSGWLLSPFQDRDGFMLEAVLRMSAFALVLSGVASIGLRICDAFPAWGGVLSFTLVGGMVACVGLPLSAASDATSRLMLGFKTAAAFASFAAAQWLTLQIQFA